MKGWIVGSQRVLLAVVMCAAVTVCQAEMVVPAAALKKVNFDIPEQPVESALTQLGQQSGLTIMVDSALSDGLDAPSVSGSYTADEVLRRILRPIGLRAEYVGDKTVAIRMAQAETTTNSSATESQFTSSEKQADLPVLADSQSPSETAPVDSGGRTQLSKGIPEILVQGSRIMNVDVTRSEDDALPYTIFDSTEIQQSGATNVEEFLKQQLTMNTQPRTSSQQAISNNGTTSAINLRGLGVGETLILIDGRRSASVDLNPAFNGFTSASQPDINGIPISAIERIEVLPSSASAIYGGAAMGGVINIILKRHFSGGDLSYTFDNVTSGNAPIRTINGSLGYSVRSTGTQFFISGQYSDATALMLRDRQDLIERGITEIGQNYPAYIDSPASPFPGATPNIAAASIFDYAHYPACSHGPTGISACYTTPSLVLKNNTSLGSPITYVPAGLAPGTDPSAGLLRNAGQYNLSLSPGTGLYGLDSPFGVSPLKRSIFVTIRQPISDQAEVFAEFSTNGNYGRASSNPLSSTGFPVSATSPVNPFKQGVVVVFPTASDSDLRSDSTTRSVTVGGTSRLGLGWNAELDYTWSRNSFVTSTFTADSSAVLAAINAGSVNPFVDTIANPLSLSSFLAPQQYSGSSSMNDLGLRASGPVAWPIAHAATLTVGLEHRKEGTGNGDYSIIYPITTSMNTQAVFFGRSQSTDSAYVEALLPLVGSSKRDSTHILELQIAGRSERYTVFNGTAYHYFSPASLAALSPPQGVRQTTNYTSTNPTIGLKFQPLRDVIFRTSYARAFLPPTAVQLLANPTPICPSGCQAVTDPNTGRTYNVDITGGGNPNLRPQISRDWDIGAIWEPRQEILHGLRIDVEYYRITQPNYITTPTAQQVVSDSSLSSRVTRDAVTGLITLVDTSYLNASEYKTSGWDVSADFTRSFAYGSLGFHGAATFIKYDLRQYALNSPLIDYAGFPNDGGEGKIKAGGTLKWSKDAWALAWTTTYYSGYKQVFSPGSPSAIQQPAVVSTILASQGGNSIPAQAYHDIYGSYEFRHSAAAHRFGPLASVVIEAGVRNVFNKFPPLDADFVPYYYSPYGDPRLREYRVNLKVLFE